MMQTEIKRRFVAIEKRLDKLEPDTEDPVIDDAEFDKEMPVGTVTTETEIPKKVTKNLEKEELNGEKEQKEERREVKTT